MDRRKFIKKSVVGVTGVASALKSDFRPSLAQEKDEPPKPFVLRIHCDGGWDQSLVFEDKSASNSVVTDPTATPATGAGDISYVSAPSRPSVDSFFANHGDKSCIINGIYSKAVERQAALRESMGVKIVQNRTFVYDFLDYYSLKAAPKKIAPYLVIDAPYFPGESDGKSFYLNTRLLDSYQNPPSNITGLSTSASEELDKYVSKNHKTFVSSLKAKGIDRLKATTLRSYRDKEADFSTYITSVMSENITGSESRLLRNSKIAIEFFARGHSQCASIQDGPPLLWDTPINTTVRQSTNYNNLFSDLSDIITYAADAGVDDNLIILVTSDAGRSPRLNSNSGKDRWPYTSALAWGKFINPGAVVGKTDDYLRGVKIDPIFGLETGDAVMITLNNVFAGLYYAANISYSKYMKGVDYLSIMLKLR